MSIGILIITHNEVGNDILSTARDIFGGLPVNVMVVSIAPGSDYDKKLVETRHCIAELDTGDGVLILTDIFGATPSNIALKAARQTNTKVVAGVNLPMLVRVLNYSQLPLTKIVDKAVSAGHDSIFECQ